LPEFAGKVNLIYIDPSPVTGADFSFVAAIAESNESVTKKPGIIEQESVSGYLEQRLRWLCAMFFGEPIDVGDLCHCKIPPQKRKGKVLFCALPGGIVRVFQCSRVLFPLQ
jgi:hypothetical protein